MTQKNLIGERIPDYLNTKSIVGMVLRDNPPAREDDRILIKMVENFCIKKKVKIPSYETITRCRRKFNEVGLYLPSKEKQEKRKENEKFFRQSAREGIL